MLFKILGMIMYWCYNLSGNYGIAIIFFTFLSKIILLPISIWVQKNSIKMVKMQPDIYKVKINYFGDKDKIADETSKLYKKEKYNAFVSLVPLFIQIVLLLGVVEVINKPLTYILNVDTSEIVSLKEDIVNKYDTLSIDSSSLELNIINEIKNNDINTFKNISVSPVNKVHDFSFNFLGFDLSWIADVIGGV